MKKKIVFGKKIGMMSLADEQGNVEGVTVIKAPKNIITEVSQGSSKEVLHVMLAFFRVKEKTLSLSKKGVFKKWNIPPHYYIRSAKMGDNGSGLKPGIELSVDQFQKDDVVHVRAKTKGRGFTGTIRRWNFKRGPMAHGSKAHRIPGSVGAGTTPSGVVKGKKMAGRYGGETVTIKNLRIFSVDSERELVFIRGSVPGSRNGMVEIWKD